MALSNWDTLAFDLNGPCNGTATNHEGYTVEIYKNWLYLRAGADTVEAKVDDGHLSWHEWEIEARRGPQDGVYVVAHSLRHSSDVPGGHTDERVLVGCGVYGFTDHTERNRQLLEAAGFDPDNELLVYEVGTRKEGDRWVNRLELLVEVGQPPVVLADDLFDAEWVGVTDEAMAFLRAMVDEFTADTRWVKLSTLWPGTALAGIDWDSAVRANQGDMYFADHLGVDAPATPVGETEKPILLQVFSDEENVSDTM